MPRQPWRLQRRFSYDLTGLTHLLRSRRTRQRASSVLLIGNVIALCAWLIVSRVLSLKRRTKQARTLDFSRLVLFMLGVLTVMCIYYTIRISTQRLLSHFT